MDQFIYYFMNGTFFIAPFLFVFTFMKTIRKVVKEEPYEGMALLTSICLLWTLASAITVFG